MGVDGEGGGGREGGSGTGTAISGGSAVEFGPSFRGNPPSAFVTKPAGDVA